MRIFALETDSELFRKRFIVKAEKEILCTHFHWILLVSRLILPCLLTIVMVSTYSALSQTFPETILFDIGLGVWIFFFCITLINAYIRWRYSFIFVTTEKVVCVIFLSLFRHEINPTHLDNINSTEASSEFGGIFSCGSLHLNLKERTKYSTKRLTYKHVPRVTTVAGAIENAIVLMKHRPEGEEGIKEQEDQIEDIRKKVPHEGTLG